MSVMYPRALIVQAIFVLILKSAHSWNPPCSPCQCSELEEEGLKISDCTAEVTNIQLAKIPQLHEETEAVYLNGQQFDNIPEEVFLKGVRNNLKFIDLKNCQVRDIHVNAFKNLEHLSGLELSHNELTNLDENIFASNNKLNILILQHNKIKVLPEKIFYNLPSLKYLDISDNKLQHVYPNQFKNNINLERLILQTNYLTKFDSNIISNLQKLEVLYLDNNPWKCDCQTKDLLKYFIDHNIEYIYDDDVYPICSQPKQWKGKTWLDIKPQELCSIKSKPKTKVTEGNLFEVSCAIETDTYLPIEWLLNGEPLDITNSALYSTTFAKTDNNYVYILRIHKITRKDSGVYKCWTNTVDAEEIQSDETILNVETGTKPNFPSPQDEQKLIRNGITNYRLKCSVVGDPLPKLQWYLNGNILKPLDGCPVTIDSTNNDLVFETFGDHCSGDYKCRATSPLGVTEKTFKLKTSKQKPVIETQSKLNATEESFVDLQCLVAASDGLEVLWLRNGATINSNNKYTITKQDINATHYNFALRIKEISLQDAGNYKCTANGDESPEYTVNVNSPIEIDHGNEEEEELALEPGQNKDVKCKIKGVKNAIITWEYPDCNKKTNVRGTTGDSTLQLKDVKCSGRYKCIVKTSKRTYKKEFNLSVKKPSISIGSPITNSASGNIYEKDTINLLCIVENAVKSQPFWTYNNIHINNYNNMKINKTIIDKNKYFYNLVLNDISLENSGEYKCNIGTQHISQQINVQKYHSVKFIEVPNKITNVPKGTQNYKLKCKASGTELDVTWKYNTFKSCRYEQYNENKNNEKTAVLVITVVLDSCTDDYICEARNKLGIEKHDIKLNVVTFEPPHIPDEITKQATENEEVVLKCLIRGAGDIKPKWIVNGNEQHNHKIVREEISQTSYWFNLVIKNVRPEDGGNYKCVVGNFEDTAILNVSPQEKPNIEYVSKIAPIEAGKKNVRIVSKVSGTPIPTATWHIPNGCKHEITRETTGDSQWIYLTIKEVTKDCGGQYTFTAKNSKGEEKSTVDVEVISIDEPPPTDIKTNSNDKTPIENENITLTCFIKTRTYTPLWLRNGQVITNNNKYKIEVENVNQTSYWYNLHIAKLSQQDKGSYKCKVNNFESEVLVNVKPSTKPVLENIPNIPPIEAGKKNVRIVSRVSGTPIPNATWHIPTGCEHEITRETQGDSQWIYLTINEVTKDCAGQYTFTAKNSKGEEKTTVDVEVLSVDGPPQTEIKTLSNDTTPIENESIILKCFIKTRTHNPQWLRFGQVITNNTKYKTEIENVNQTSYWYNLHIEKLSQQDKGSYKCKVNNFESDVSLNVKPSTKPVLEYIPNIPPIEAGKKNVRLVSKVSGTPIPNATWEIPSGCKHDITRETQGDSQWIYLTINEVTKDCAGQYTFTAKNSKGEEKTTVDVDVLLVDGPPPTEIKSLSNDKTPIENENIILKCFIKTRTHNPQWLRYGQIITNNTKYKIEIENVNQTSYWYNLHIEKLSQQDKGSYKCKVNNFESDVLLNVKPSTKPVLEYIPNIPPIEAGKKNVRIVSKVSGTPIPNATWHIPSGCKHDITRETQGDSKWIYLTINEVTKDCAGQYTFTAKNSKGEKKTTVDVEVLSVDKPPLTKIKTLSNDTTPIENENIILECFIKTRTYNPQWLRDGQVITNNNKYKIEIINVNQTSYWYNLHIAKLSQQDKGSYKCRVNNMESNIPIVDIKQSSKPFIEYISNPINVEEGKKDFTLSCKVSGIPKPKVSWNVQGKPISTIHSNYLNCRYIFSSEIDNYTEWAYLTIRNVDPSCTGHYTCDAKNVKGDEQNTIHLGVISKNLPKIQPLPDKIYEGGNVTLNCLIQGNLDSKPYWILNNKPVETSNKYRTIIIPIDKTSYWYNLEIKQVSSQEQGNYKCKVNDLETPVLLNILPSSKPELLPEDFPAGDLNINEKIKERTLPCRARGTPPPKIIWYYENVPLYQNTKCQRQVKIGNNQVNLILQNIGPSCAGKYKCVIENVKGKTEREVNVNINSVQPPIIQAKTDNKILITGENFSLKCLVPDRRKYSAKWYRKNELIILEPNGRYSFTIEDINATAYWHNLEISKLVPSDKGEYKCIINGIEGTYTIPELQQPVKPKIEYIPAKDLILQEGTKDFRLACKVSGIPKPLVTWQFEPNENAPKGTCKQTTPKISEDSELAYLVLEEVTPSCFGKYSCVTRNSAGFEQQEINLSVTSNKTTLQLIVKPNSPDGVIRENNDVTLQCLTTGTNAKVSWYYYRTLIKNGGKFKLSKQQVNPITTLHTLTIKNIQPQDKGTFTCKTSNSQQSHNLEIASASGTTVEYLVQPNLIADEYTDTVLSCKVSNIGDSFVEWTFNGDPIADSSCMSETSLMSESTERDLYSNLTIYNIGDSCSGQFKCEVDSIQHTNVIDVTVITGIEPDITQEPNKDTIMEGEKIILKCFVTSGNIDSAKWYFKDIEIESNDKYIITRFILNETNFWYNLEIPKAQVYQQGEYKCKSGNFENSVNVFINPEFKPIIQTISNPETIVQEGGDITLVCKSNAWPPAIVNLKQKHHSNLCHIKETFDPKSQLNYIKIANVHTSCAGQYVCTASNSKGEDTKYINLIVVPTKKPEIILNSTSADGIIREGDTVTFSCLVTGKNKDKAKWHGNGIPNKNVEIKSHEIDPLTTKIELTVTSIALKQSGTYTCGTPELNNFKNIVVTPGTSPAIDNIPDSIVTVSGTKSPTVYCKVSGFPKPNVNWFFNGRPVNLQNICKYKINSDDHWYNMTIDNPISACIGNYKCVASSTKGKTEKEVTVRSVQPQTPETKVITNDNTSIVKENDKITLNCLIKGDISIPIQWLYNGKPVQFNQNHKIIREPNDQTSFWYNLQISRASLQHNGIYQCKTPFSQSNISLNVQKSRKPTIAVSSTKVFIPPGKDQLITCSTDGIPIPSVTWRRNNKTVDICSHDCQLKTQEVTNNETGSRRLYLTVNSTESCSGNYKCIAENANGKIEKSVDVVVIPPEHPKIYIREPVYPTLNTDVILCCEIESVDNPTISWKNQDKNIDYDRSKYDVKTVNVGNNIFISNLTIRNFQSSDMADYRCEAKLHNIYRSKTISLKPKRKFEPHFEHLPKLWNNMEIKNNDLILINKVKSYPPPKWQWNLNSNENSSRNPRYKTAVSYINNDSYWFNVTISNFNENHDAGLYTFAVNNEIGKDEKRVFVEIDGGSLQFTISQRAKGISQKSE